MLCLPHVKENKRKENEFSLYLDFLRWKGKEWILDIKERSVKKGIQDKKGEQQIRSQRSPFS